VNVSKGKEQRKVLATESVSLVIGFKVTESIAGILNSLDFRDYYW